MMFYSNPSNLTCYYHTTIKLLCQYPCLLCLLCVFTLYHFYMLVEFYTFQTQHAIDTTIHLFSLSIPNIKIAIVYLSGR